LPLGFKPLDKKCLYLFIKVDCYIKVFNWSIELALLRTTKIIFFLLRMFFIIFIQGIWIRKYI